MLGLLYIVLALGGCAFIVFSAATGVGDGADGGVDAADGDFHFSLLSPLTLAILFASIGAYGLIARHGFGVGETASVLIAVGAGLVTAYAVGRTAFRMIASTRGSSSIPAAAFVGATADVVTAIPAGGIGEVVVLVNNQRYTGAARSSDGRAVEKGAAVTVERLSGTTLLVRPAAQGDP